jgi:hypothetical protein
MAPVPCGPDLNFDSTQFGRKWGYHSKDWDLDVRSAEARKAFEERVRKTYSDPEEVRIGPWNPGSGGATDYRFHRSGNMVVLSKKDGTFVTVLRIEPGSDRWKNGWWDGADRVRGK